MNPNLRKRLERLERQSENTGVNCTFAFQAVRAGATYSDYLHVWRLIKPGVPDPVTGSPRWEWRDAQSERFGAELVQRLGLALGRDWPFLPLLADQEVERLGELLALPSPMPEAEFHEWQKYVRWATEGPPVDRDREEFHAA